MPIVTITDAWVRSVKPTPEKPYEDYWDDKLKGFGCWRSLKTDQANAVLLTEN